MFMSVTARREGEVENVSHLKRAHAEAENSDREQETMWVCPGVNDGVCGKPSLYHEMWGKTADKQENNVLQ